MHNVLDMNARIMPIEEVENAIQLAMIELIMEISEVHLNIAEFENSYGSRFAINQ